MTNGACAAERIRAAGVAGDIVTWDDVLHEGPVPRGDLDAVRPVRARFIAGQGWDSYQRTLEGFAARDAALANAGGAEVMLLFEHDLYDQLQLIQVLAWAATRPVRALLTLACEAEYLGMMGAERMRALVAARRPVSDAQYLLAARAWEAFTAPDGRALASLVAGADMSALPFLGAALRRLLEEFPSERDGLSRSERQALEVLADGPLTPGEAFPRAHHQKEDPVFLGDTVFADYLERLSAVRTPLLTFDDGSTVRAPRGAAEYRPFFFERRVRLTPTGREVLAGRANHVSLNGIDRWIGGVHLAA